MRYLAYRNLVDISHTEEEAKKEAEEIQTLDGPDEAGNMFMRPGKLADYFPRCIYFLGRMLCKIPHINTFFPSYSLPSIKQV